MKFFWEPTQKKHFVYVTHVNPHNVNPNRKSYLERLEKEEQERKEKEQNKSVSASS